MAPREREAARQQTGLEGQPVLLWVGGLTPNKDPLTVLRGCEAFLGAQPRARLYMIHREDDLAGEVRATLGASPLLVGSRRWLAASCRSSPTFPPFA
jgi:hypothetical protein